jgi:hypothetical protein
MYDNLEVFSAFVLLGEIPEDRCPETTLFEVPLWLLFVIEKLRNKYLARGFIVGMLERVMAEPNSATDQITMSGTCPISQVSVSTSSTSGK